MRPPVPSPTPACSTRDAHRAADGSRTNLGREGGEFIVALAGNPNTGKSTVFNALTGLRQHTGNWPGKTVTRAEGAFEYQGQRYRLVDLPGTYSLLATSLDEEIARNFILFEQPDVTVVVVDATRLERNLNLVLQVLEITDRVVVCLNLMDEARRLGLQVDDRRLARDLGVPVVRTAARYWEGLSELMAALAGVATGRTVGRPHRLENQPPDLNRAVTKLIAPLERLFPGLPNARWVALRLLDGDERVVEAVRLRELGRPAAGASYREADRSSNSPTPEDQLLGTAQTLRWETGDFREPLVAAIYADAARIASGAVRRPEHPPRFDLDRAIDRIVTSRVLGFPLMALLFTVVFWITISGANIPSGWLSSLLLGRLYPELHEAAIRIGLPWWLSGVLIDGIYLTAGWVVSVMLPPMAIFFPLFTVLEDFGYLPRVAFNLDHLFKKAGAHGKQALSLMMGFGCNAAGVVATRVIDSPRERMIAILTNNFALCNGRWPTQILLATLFIGALVPAHWAGLISAAAVVGVAVLGVLLTLAVSWALSRTVLRGEVSTFSLELPPYRPPRVLQTLYTSLIDRTLLILWRAVIFAVPAGVVIWLIANVHFGGASVAQHLIQWLDPVGLVIGLNGVILLAYVVAIPANEIVIPTVLMLTVLATRISDVGQGAGVLFVLGEADTLALLRSGGWTLLTAVNLMLFSLVHNPCSTALYTIYAETGSLKWTAVAAALPLALGFMLTFFVAQVWRLAGGVG
jgi:ferrous iron transport protein B